jgi:predicted Zn-dependent peptidase
MLTRGTQRLTFAQFSEEVEMRGCAVRSGCDRDNLTLSAFGLREYIDDMMGLLAESFLTPRFDDAEIASLKRIAAANYQQDNSDPDFLANWALVRAAFGNHPYAWLRDGTPDTIDALNADRLRAVHARFLAAPRTIIIAGGFDPDAAMKRIDETLGTAPRAGDEVRIPDAIFRTRQAVIAHKDDSVQSVIRVALPGIPLHHQDSTPLNLVLSVLGGYTMARLFTILREQKGYTYGAYGYPDTRRHASQMVLTASVGNQFTADTIATLESELKRMRSTLIDVEELENARQHVLGMFARTNETPQQTASLLWARLQFGLPETYFETHIERLQRLTPEHLIPVQELYMDPHRWSFGISGDATVIREALDGHVDAITMLDLGAA